MIKFLETGKELELAKQNFTILNSKSMSEVDESITKKLQSMGIDPQDVEINFVYSKVEFPDETVQGVRIVEYTFKHNGDRYMFKLMYSDGAWLWNMDDDDVNLFYSVDNISDILV